MIRRDRFLEISDVLTSQIVADDEDYVVIERGSVGVELTDADIDRIVEDGFALIHDGDGSVAFTDIAAMSWPYPPRASAAVAAAALVEADGFAGWRLRDGMLWLMDPFVVDEDGDEVPAIVAVECFEMALNGNRFVAPIPPKVQSLSLGNGIFWSSGSFR